MARTGTRARRRTIESRNVGNADRGLTRRRVFRRRCESRGITLSSNDRRACSTPLWILDIGGTALADFQAVDVVLVSATLVFHDPQPAQDLDRPRGRRWADVPLHGKRGGGPCRRKAGCARVVGRWLLRPGLASRGVRTGRKLPEGVFGFLGVSDTQTIIAEGVAIGPEQRKTALDGALAAAAALT